MCLPQMYVNNHSIMLYCSPLNALASSHSIYLTQATRHSPVAQVTLQSKQVLVEALDGLLLQHVVNALAPIEHAHVDGRGCCFCRRRCRAVLCTCICAARGRVRTQELPAPRAAPSLFPEAGGTHLSQSASCPAPGVPYTVPCLLALLSTCTSDSYITGLGFTN